MSDFKIGDIVETVDDVIKGRIIGIDGTQILMTTKDGFQMTFMATDLVKIADEIVVSNFEVAQVKSEKEFSKKKKVPATKPKERNAPKMEVDLHIHQLTNSIKGLSNYDMLNLQVETAKKQLEFAMRKRIQKVIFIHGVGEGVLKEELMYLFGRYENVKYYDADYQKYGLGATEVYIMQNG